MRIGVFGGTFDPPHVGHLILASEACVQLNLDKVFWLLTPISPFKQTQDISPLDIRIEMLQAAISDNQHFDISHIDIDRLPPYFAVDSLDLLISKYPDNTWIYLLGSDSLCDLPSWHEPHRFVAACSMLGVFRRPGTLLDFEDLNQKLNGLIEKVSWIEAPGIDISASHIRQLVRSGGAFRYYVPPKVYDIILNRNLYREAA